MPVIIYIIFLDRVVIGVVESQAHGSQVPCNGRQGRTYRPNMYALPIKSCRHIMRQRFIQAATERVSAFGAFGDQIVRSMVYASILHESSCFNTSRAPGSRTPSIIYFQPMKQTRADMLGVEYVCIRLIIPTLSSTRDRQSHV